MAGFWDSLGGARGIGSGIRSALGGIGNIFNTGSNLAGQIPGAIGGGINSLFRSFGGGVNQGSNYFSGGGGSMPGGPGQQGQAGISTSNQTDGQGFGGIFKNPFLLAGLGMMTGSQLIRNKQPASLPPSFNMFQQQANAGGPPIQQQSNQYLQTLLSGQNTAANDAATHSLDLNYQEELRKLNGMYKSLRGGTDPSSDTTYQRDLANLNDQYARQRAQILAQQQLGAAGQGLQAGQAQAAQQQAALEAELSRLNAQYQADQMQRQGFRDQFGNLGGILSTLGALQKLFPNFGQR